MKDSPHSVHGHGDHGGAWAVALFCLCAAMGVAYVVGVRWGQRTRRWSRWRTTSFLSGLAMVLVAVWPPLAALAHQELRLHMAQHVLLGMLGPIGLVLGAPVTLALRALPVSGARRLATVLKTPVFHWLSHPALALVLNLGGMAALYLTPLYERMGREPILHFVVHLHFLAAGCLFSWTIAGVDPAPRRPSHITRLVYLFIATAAHATLSKAMYAYGWPQGVAPRTELEAAAQVMYYGGDLSEALLAVALFAKWPWSREATRSRSAT